MAREFSLYLTIQAIYSLRILNETLLNSSTWWTLTCCLSHRPLFIAHVQQSTSEQRRSINNYRWETGQKTLASAGRPPERERERGRTLLTIDKQSVARADDGGVANDTAAAVDSISIPLGGGGGGGGKEQRTGSSTNCPLPILGPIYSSWHTHGHTEAAKETEQLTWYGGMANRYKRKKEKRGYTIDSMDIVVVGTAII
jgi:hypothetical protein